MERGFGGASGTGPGAARPAPVATDPRLLCLEARAPSYPPRLLHLDDPPDRLWARGLLALATERRPRIAVVGSRAPTPYGLGQAERFGRALAAGGVVVVSGLARGIDQAAHRGALEAGGDTVAVLGSGLERPWPDSPLVERIAEAGLLLSEYEPRQPPRPHHFPARNRLIAALCDGLLVVEAAEASGSLITARQAVDLGREVAALPGRVDHPMSRGGHRLLREGAALIEDPAELVELVYGAGGARLAAEPCGPEPEGVEAGLVGEDLTADELAERLARPVREVLVELARAEVAGRLTRGPGGVWRRP